MPTEKSATAFVTPQVRDLAWTIQSPGLLDPAYKQYQPSPGGDGAARPVAAVIDDGWCERQFLQHRQWLRGLDADPRGLIEWLKPHYDSFGKPLSNPRLGYYFESLVEFWLRYGCAYQPLIAHLQVKDAQRTVGEFDYLFMDSARQAVQHWEVAVKFYLHHEDANGRILWYGPNPRDRLDLKLQRLFHHQLTLSSHPAAMAALRRCGLPGPVLSQMLLRVLPQVLLKGYLFYPSHSQWRTTESRSAGLSAHHLRGWWTYIEPFLIPNADQERRWLFLPRLQWLAPATASENSEKRLMDLAQLHGFCLDLVKRQQRPPLIAEMRWMDDQWQEVSRGFVLPQTWPRVGSNQ